jgi:uroporphyrinogen-III synthase
LGQLDAAIASLESYDWVIFTSANGVHAFVSRLRAVGKEVSTLCALKLGAIGPATGAELHALGCNPAFMPDTYVAEAIVEQIEDIEGCRILLPRADIARKALAIGLRERGAHVDEVAAYRTVHANDTISLAALLSTNTVDVVTFTSSSTVRYTVEGIVAAGYDKAQASEMLNQPAIVCIGPITAATARECGLRVSAVAAEYTTDGLVKALVTLFAGSEGTVGTAKKETTNA